MTHVIPLFLTYKVSNPIVKYIIFFSGQNNAKYLLPLQTLIDPSILSSLICNGFAPIKVLYKMSLIKVFLYDFSSVRILSKSKYSNLIMSSKQQHTRFLIRTF